MSHSLLRLPLRPRRLLGALVALLCLGEPAGAESEPFPLPASLEPAVRFWTKIYTEIDSNRGFLHDPVYLDVVYQVVEFPPGMSHRAREKRIRKLKEKYTHLVRRLARHGKRTGLPPEEARVLALWPKGVSSVTLRKAKKRVRFQLGQADRFREGLVRSGAWRGYIEETLLSRDVPVELAVLPHVESSYNTKAYSRVGAAGMWQFTRSTGRLYLRVGHVVDERLDPFLSTRAAAKLLRDNYERLQSWPLAITAYNHGPAGMARAVRTVGTRDIGAIVEKYNGRTFGFASRNFYASFLAALEVDRNAEKYFGPVKKAAPAVYTNVEMDHFYRVGTLVRAFGIDAEILREDNPALRPSVWNGSKYVPRKYVLRLPPNRVGEPDVVLASIPAGERLAEQHRDRFYKVRRGDTLSKIARRYRVRERELVAHNNLRSRHRIRVGQVLVLPDDAAGASIRVARAEPPADGIYRVRRGDTVSIIAKRFGVSEKQLVAHNELRNRHRISVGQSLELPTASAPAPKPSAPAAPPPASEPVPAATVASATPAPALRAAPAPGAPKPPPATPPQMAASAPAVEVASAPETAVNGEPEVVAVSEPSPGLPLDPSNYAVSGQRIVVQADETLGHYAEWLEIPTSRLRRLNGMAYGTPVALGKRVKLDFDLVTPETFEMRRLAYHRSLQEEFFEAFAVIDTHPYSLKPGESLWYLAERKFRVPVWLLRQYNPDTNLATLRVNTMLTIPVIVPREG